MSSVCVRTTGVLALLASIPLAPGACAGDHGAPGPGTSESPKTARMSFDEFEGSVNRETGTGVYIVDGDTPITTREQLADFYRTHVHEGALVVNRVVGIDRWSDVQKRSLTYCVSTAFGDQYATVVAAMLTATAAWEAAANVDFIHVSSHDSACDASNASVVFDVSPTSGQPPMWREPSSRAIRGRSAAFSSMKARSARTLRAH